jgi:hypothetical protein
MKKMVFCLALPLGMMAQVTKPNAEFYKQPGGTLLYTATDSVPVHTMPAADGFFNTSSLWLVAGTGDVDALAPGTVLYGMEGQALGKVQAETFVADASTAPGKFRKSHTLVRLEGYLHQSRLNESTVPELAIPALMQAKGMDQRKQMDRIRNSWKTVETDDLIGYLAMDRGARVDPKPEMKMALVFKPGQAQPFAVVSRGIALQLPKVKETKTEGDLYFYYFQKPNAAVHEAVDNLVLPFLPL